MDIARRSACPLHRMRGFTLVELMVAMALMSLVVLAMASALRTMAQTESRVDGRLSRMDDVESVAVFLRSVVGRVVVKKNPASLNTNDAPYLFQADPDSLTWIGVMPARFGMGGRYFFHLAVEASPSGAALVLRYQIWTPNTGFPNWAAAQQLTLIEQIESFQLQYENPQRSPDVWSASWRFPANAVNDLPADRFPSRVQINLGRSGQAWPPLVVVMRPLSGAADGGEIVGIGGQG
ncbi:MAG: prepilin-type N-terminal cleavage/methylation domain-containing protein [Curvibacter sp.]|nr:prepilin-type N-terminal cleavage/methylation domain-containing protein [Curvibacter sp.]